MTLNVYDDLLTASRVLCNARVSSKKKSLQLVSELLATALKPVADDTGRDDDEDVGEMRVMDALAARERLGCTGMGHGVAIPHGRVNFVDKPVGAVAILDQPIPFDAPDDEDVNIVFGLLMPEEQIEEHLQVLAALATFFSEQSNREALRNANDANAVLETLLAPTTDDDVKRPQ